MEELVIRKDESTAKKVINIIIGAYLSIFCLYFTTIEGIDKHFGIFFILALIGFILAITLVLSNTLWANEYLLKVDNNIFETNPHKQKKAHIEWVKVSKVKLGNSYIIFELNGGVKQQRVDLAFLTYTDLLNIKTRLIDLCEHKKIPFQND